MYNNAVSSTAAIAARTLSTRKPLRYGPIAIFTPRSTGRRRARNPNLTGGASAGAGAAPGRPMPITTRGGGFPRAEFDRAPGWGEPAAARLVRLLLVVMGSRSP